MVHLKIQQKHFSSGKNAMYVIENFIIHLIATMILFAGEFDL